MWRVVLCLLLLFTTSSYGQTGPGGQPERVEIDDLIRMGGLYSQKTVIVIGELRSGDTVDYESQVYRLRGSNTLLEIRVAEQGFSSGALRFIQGHRVEITGIFWDLVQECDSDPRSGAYCLDSRIRRFPAIREGWESDEHRYFIGISNVDSLEIDVTPDLDEEPEEEPEDLDIPSGELIDLRTLLEHPEPFTGKRISVIGKFRGNNLYSDLSIRTKKTPRDFVIKVADAAIWVTGRRPRGKDFELNSRMRRDTGKWLKVTGIPWMDGEMTYLKAEKMELVPKPDDPELEPVEAGEEEEAEELGPPPEVYFSLPLDGERGIPLDTEFRVQFSNDMDSLSFDRNVDLLYTDDDGFSNPFPGMQISYDAAGRTLLVTPGRELEPGKELQLILYGDIVDEDGQRLVVVSGAEKIPDAAVILTFFTANR